MAKEDWKHQLILAKEENVRLKFEIIGLKEQMEERIKQARQQERAKIAGEVLGRIDVYGHIKGKGE